MNDYRSKKCCQDFSDLSKTFKIYKKEREHIISELKSDPSGLTQKLWSEYLSNDKHCMKNSGHGQIYSNSECIPCFNLAIMVDHDIVDIKKSFQVLDKNLIIIKNEIGNVGSEISENDKSMAVNFLKKNKVLLTCGTQDISELTFFRSDKFTNNLLIWWIVDNILKSEGESMLTLHNGYVCGNSGFLLTDYPIIGGFDKLIMYQTEKLVSIEKTVETIMNQLRNKLKILSKYYFSHGNPDINRLTFSQLENNENDEKSERIEHSERSERSDEHSETDNFDLHIIDYNYSSITLENVRIYPKSVRAEMLLKNGSIDIDISDGMYKIKDDKSILFHYIRHAGLPLYSTSFDYYNFMISLMKKKVFRDAVYSHSHLNERWESLWMSDDISNVNEMIKNNKSNLDIMSNKWLRCNPF